MKQMIRVALMMGLVTGVAVAQNPPAAAPKAAQPKAQAAPAVAVEPGQPGHPARPARPGAMMRGQPDRAQLEQQIRNRIGNQLKQGLNLSDDQFAKLQATNKRFEERRHLLVEQERDVRMGMRDLMIAGDTTNQAKVSATLDKMLQVQRQRFELVEQEQKELSGYLSPMQRAHFLGMQEQMSRRVQALRAQAGGGRGPGGAGPMPGMGSGMGAGMGQGMGQGMGPGGMGPQGQPGAGARFQPGQRPLRQGGRPRLNGPPAAAPPPVPPLGNDIP